MNPHNLDDRIAALCKRTGHSEVEIRQAIIEQADRLLSESDIAWKGRSANDVIGEVKTERQRILNGIHNLSLEIKHLTAIAQERLHLVESAHLVVARRLGMAQPFPALPEDEALVAGGGFLTGAGQGIIPEEEKEKPHEPGQSQ